MGDLPGATPLPLHWSHSSRRRICTCLVTPKTASSNSSVRSSRRSAPRCARVRRAAALSEHVAKAEEVAEDVLEIVEDGGIEAAETLTGGGAYAGVAEAIVARALLGVGEHGVGLAAFLEALFGLGIIGIAVGMILQRELAVRALDFLIAGRARDAQNLVVVTFHSSGQK